MKFAEHLGAHVTPEWRKQYIQYDVMKSMLYVAIEEEPSPEDDLEEEEQLLREKYKEHITQFEEVFFSFCDSELIKINNFFAEKLSEARRKFSALKSELDDLHRAAEGKKVDNAGAGMKRHTLPYVVRNTEHSIRNLHAIKLAFSEYYLSLILLQNYQTLNFTGFRKILKKHDKLVKNSDGSKWFRTNVEMAPFYVCKDVDQVIKDIEAIFTNQLEGGDRQKAMKRLRVPPIGEAQDIWTTFRVGLFAGSAAMLISAILITVLTRTIPFDWQPALIMFRGSFLLILATFVIAINNYGWRSSGVNHVLIFELNPRHHLTHTQLLECSLFFLVFWALSLLGFLYSESLFVPAYIFPLIFTVLSLLWLFNPFRIFHYKARMWLLKVTFRIFTAPFHYVSFADFWLADQMNSLAIVLLDFEYLVCYYSVEVSWLPNHVDGICGKLTYGLRPVVSCLPAWFRFAQCLRRYRDTGKAFPHLVNAGKYATTFLVVLFSTLSHLYSPPDSLQKNLFFYLLIISSVFSTCYTYTWDIRMDWGLMEHNAGENWLLREEIVYSHQSYYYFAMVEDLLLRMSWAINISLGDAGFKIVWQTALSTILASLEVFRRFVWNFFRLENEHLNNCGQFRAVRDISIKPITTDDYSMIERQMDGLELPSHIKHVRRRYYAEGKKTPADTAISL